MLVGFIDIPIAFPYRSLVKFYGEPLYHRGCRLVCVFERPARNQSVACSTVIGNLPIFDSKNRGMGSKIAAALSRPSASWPFTTPGSGGLLWRNTNGSPVRSS